MLEVVFSDSTKGSMKMAQNYDAEKMIGGAIAYIGFSLDIGDISGEIDGIERQNIFRKLWGRFDFDANEQEQFFQSQRKEMENLLSAATEGTPIRIWKSNAPYSTCGFYFICNLLRNIDCEISVVSLPEYKLKSEKTIASFVDWGQIEAGEFHKFLFLEKQLSQFEKRMFSNLWCDLTVENAPLRALVNGKLISVPEAFYDHLIINNIPDHNFLMGRLIGEIIGKYRLGVGDNWYALRIEKMIEENKLVVVENKDESHPYQKILKKVTA